MSRSRSGSPRGGYSNERPSFRDGGRREGGGPPRSEDLHSIKVDGMSLRTTKDDVRDKFSRFGEIGDIFFPSDKYTGSSRGFCFVRFFKKESQEDACDHFRDGFDMDDKLVRVEAATQRPRPGTDNWDPERRRFNDRDGGSRGGRGGYGDRNRSFGGRDDDRGGFGQRPNFREKADSMFSLKISDMTLRTNKDDVREKFDRFGEIGDLFFPPDRDTGASRGFCYVRFHKKDDMLDALDHFRSGVELDGKTAHVEESIPNRGGGRGGFRGGFGGRDRDGGFRDRNDRYGGDKRMDRFDERDRYGGRGRDRSRSRSPRYRGRDSRSPPRRQRSRSPDYDRYRRRSRSPYRR